MNQSRGGRVLAWNEFGKWNSIKSNKSLHTPPMSNTGKPCPFCTLPAERIIDSNAFGVTIRDGFPVSPGHTLVIPKRHVGSWFEISKEDQISLMELITKAQKVLEEEFGPDGYNIGINDGPASLKKRVKEELEKAIKSYQ